MENLPAVKESMFFDVARFEHGQRVGKMLAEATMVPDHFKRNVGNVMIALNLADRLQADPLMVMQNMYIIHGMPGISGQLAISMVNASGRFSILEFETIGNVSTPKNDDDGCLAYATEKSTGKVLKGPVVDWRMVKADGWYGKNGSKWKSIAPQMFRYRSAVFFARTYCPDVLLGMQTRDELQDIVNVTPAVDGTYEVAVEDESIDLSNKDISMYSGGTESAKEETPEPAKDIVEKVTDELKERPPEPRKGAGNPAYNGPPDDKNYNGTPKEEKHKPPSYSWDPVTAPLMSRYVEDKRTAVLESAEKFGLQVKGKTPRQVHEMIKNANEAVDPPIEIEPEEDTPQLSTREKFYLALETRGFDGERLEAVNDCIMEYSKRREIGVRDLMLSWLGDIDKFIANFELWASAGMEAETDDDSATGSEHETENEIEAPPSRNVSGRADMVNEGVGLRLKNKERWDAICEKHGQVSHLPAAIDDVSLISIIRDFKAIDAGHF